MTHRGWLLDLAGRVWRRKEAIIWLGALLFLGTGDPACHHYTLCPLSNLGFEFCPGCGLGRSIGYLFRGEVVASFMAHPLGIPALILLVQRVVKIIARPDSFKLSTI